HLARVGTASASTRSANPVVRRDRRGSSRPARAQTLRNLLDAMTMADVTELDATAVVHQLLAAAGSRRYDSCLIEFERLRDIGCDLLFAVRDRPGDVPIGARTAHPRDVAEDVWHAFVHAARRWPDRFLEHVLSNPALHEDIEILNALAEVDRPAARALLVAAVNQRRAGHALGREYAIR